MQNGKEWIHYPAQLFEFSTEPISDSHQSRSSIISCCTVCPLKTPHQLFFCLFLSLSFPDTLSFSYLTCFPWMRARRQRLTMFHEVLFSYRIRFRAIATCEWQLSQHRLCFGEDNIIKNHSHYCLNCEVKKSHSHKPHIYHPVFILL